ncbi:MAG TPA: cobalamin-independent methionine synthase II family protein [Solirubrobacteraceae bacterium]|jgi:5-methyltetrahydropteroyltriglutamate--homocysteine methyltransferase|nr:cobalamin-independent methionine synthase II family protein [Solirubrobacteraceae bacterium]
MQMSTDRILTTHTGSLPRPEALAKAIDAHDRGTLDAGGERALPGQVADAVADCVRRQREAGVDVVGDGEMSKMVYSTYVRERLTGFDGEDAAPIMGDLLDYMGYAQRLMGTIDFRSPACTGPVSYTGQEAVQQDIANLRAVVGDSEAFMSAASPGVASLFLVDRHYGDHETYLYALADALKEEYDAIHAAGLLVQLDCPDLAMGAHITFADGARIENFPVHVAQHVAAVNHATRDIPREALRVHLCWGNYEGPHHQDVPLEDIVDEIVKLDCGALLFEGANPRHEHEWRVWAEAKLPDDTILIPGVIDSTSNYIEHPRLVADRLERFADIVGRERVMAGTDCGMATIATYNPVEPEIAWSKLRAMADGAEIATSRLWS